MLPVALALVFAVAAPKPMTGRPTAKPDAVEPPQSVEATFHHDLSTATGRVALNWPSLFYDRAHDEIFVVAEGFVRVFDSTGMEVYRFGEDGALGNVTRVVVLEDGQILALSTIDGRRAYVRCDFRGDFVETFSLNGLPKTFGPFEPDQMAYRGGKLYFAERGTMRVVMTDTDGVYKQSFQLRDLVARAVSGDTERKPAGSMDGFNVDSAGNMLFTMSTMFAGATGTPRGVLRLFGSRGSTPGRFNIIGGIDSDEAGNVYVTDRLRSVVSVWDRELRHLADFGYRGDAESNLLTPFEIAVGNGKVFVAQAGLRGVKVFRVQFTDAVASASPGR
jgi:hypothetical protein